MSLISLKKLVKPEKKPKQVKGLNLGNQRIKKKPKGP